MQEVYWSQRAANLLQENMISVPDDFTIQSQFLCGCSKQEFIKAFKHLHQLAFNIYTDMAQNPVDYGLPLYEITQYRAASKEAHASAHSPRNFARLMYYLGQSGEIVDNKLTINIEKYKAIGQKKKVAGATKILNKLPQFGFELTGFNGKNLSKDFAIAYPTMPSLINVLKAYTMTIDPARNCVPTFFTIFSHKLFSITSGFYELEPSDFSDRLESERSEFFNAIHSRMVDLGYTIEVIYEGPFSDTWIGRYFINNKQIGHYARYKGDSFYFRLKLNHAGAYTDFVETCSEDIQSPFENNQPCSHCNGDNCGYRVSYSFRGKPHEACIYGVFFFNDPKIEDIDSYIQLVKLEQEAANNKKSRSK